LLPLPSAEAEPWLAAAPAVVAAVPAVVPINPHANSGELITHPNGAITPDTTLSVKAAAADHLHAKAVTYATRGPYLGYGLGHAIWKREAEAEAEPWLGYGYGIAPAVAPLAYGAPLCVNGAWGHGLCKREAEAEPWLGYGLPAVGLPVAPLVAHPNGAVTPDYTPAQKLAAADHFAKGGGRVHALPLLAGHAIWKREAEAEPWLGYGYGLPAVGLPVAPLVAHPNGAVTPDYTPAQKLAAADHFAKGGGRVHLPLLAGHAIWKREAEAAPYYGLGYGGYAGLGYGGYAGLGYGAGYGAYYG